MTFEQALSAPGPLVAVWEAWATQSNRTVLVYSVRSRPTRLAETTVPEAARAALSNELHQRGVRQGTYAPLKDHFWCADEQGFALWSMAGLELEGKAGELHLPDRRRITSAQVRAVVSFVDGDMVRRGVRLELNNGASAVVAHDEDPAALADPTYNVDNLALDASWARHLGAALAGWLGTAHVDQVP
jgi:hypothetical protein